MSNEESLLFYEMERDEWLDVLQAVRTERKTFLVYGDEENDPEAVLVPWDWYRKIQSGEYAVINTRPPVPDCYR